MAKDPTPLTIKRKKGDDGYRVFSVRIPAALIDQIDQIAENANRSRNEIVTQMLEYGVANCKIED